MRHLLSILSIMLILASCNTTTTDKKVNKDNANSEITSKSGVLPMLPVEVVEDIIMNADYLDILFEELDFSMSQDKNRAIRIFLQNIDYKTPLKEFNKDCKPLASVLISKNSNTIIEADVYHWDGCYYFIFLDENRKPKYANNMSEIGIRFFQNLKERNFETSN